MPGGTLVDAATVLLLRPAGASVEALLVQRHPQLSFMGGLWAFPGGRLEDADRAAHADADDPVDAAFRVAACRELQEECAIELAPAQLLFFSHWITPSMSPRRFDTRFYLAITEPHARRDARPARATSRCAGSRRTRRRPRRWPAACRCRHPRSSCSRTCA
ncbi:MAG: NUDIX domain-containing protein [Steroidobacteraceae bacterium]